jgi:hypothetical protein
MLAYRKGFGSENSAAESRAEEDEERHRQRVKNVLDRERRQSDHQRHAIFNKHTLRRFAHRHTDERNDVAERVAHQSRGESIAKRQSMRRFDAASPGERANDVTNARNGENENEAGAESLNAARRSRRRPRWLTK